MVEEKGDRVKACEEVYDMEREKHNVAQGRKSALVDLKWQIKL